MKSLFKSSNVNELKLRVNNLTETSKPVWGEMTATEMLHHCNIANQAILAGGDSDKKTTFKQKLVRFFVLKVVGKLPRNATAPYKINIKKRQLATGTFQHEQETYLAILNQFSAAETPINAYHPYFGKLSTNEWGAFVYLHLDHHLRQFGV